MKGLFRLLAYCSVLAPAPAALSPGNVVPVDAGLTLQVFSPSTLRVVHTPRGRNATRAALERVSLAVTAAPQPDVDYRVTSHAATQVATAVLATGDVTIRDAATGAIIFTEAGRAFKADGSATQILATGAGAVYGGGAFQDGVVDHAGAPLQLAQSNIEAVLAFWTSTQGWGMLWDNPSWSWMNRHDLQALSPLDQGAPGTTFYDVTAAKGGSHWFYFDTAPQKDGYSFGADKQTVHLTVAGGGLTRVILDWDDAANFPAAMAARIDLTAGTNYRVELRTTAANSALSLRRADAELSLTSRVGALIDYYVTWDGTRTMDGAISNGYRFLTGEASLYKRFAFGLWHSRERYHNQSELLDAARTFRKLKIPVDAIVQDWHYWGDLGWGPHWDSALYPDPRGMVSALKVEAIELMVSVWSRFDASTDFFKNMTRDGFMIVPKDVAEDNLYYDAFNPEARAAFYGFSKKAHFDIGVEALWLDATEPEYFPQRHADVFPAAGLDWSPGPQGDALFNAYSLETTRAVSDGLRRDFPTKQGSRVFSLTRSAFAGQQRTGAVLWSGDLSSTWDMLRRQVASSLNYAAAGMPYWSQDVGGFFRPGDQHTSKDYQACLTRWRPPASVFRARPSGRSGRRSFGRRARATSDGDR